MKISISNILIILLLSACARDRAYIKNLYLTHQIEQDLEQNRNQLYKQSYVGVQSEIPKK
ncbi:MAG: hypothetical protein EXR06_01250 [Rickettsiales bacterium]|nr:hypothetical protein [Rickettsiales bacterium]